MHWQARGNTMREAWRQLQHGTLEPLARLIEGELMASVYSQVVDDDTWSQANPINDVGAIGRISAIPTASWPDTPDGVFAMQYSRGLAGNDPDIDIVRSLAILKLRDLFLAIPMHRGQSAYDRLAARVRRFDTPPFETIGAA